MSHAGRGASWETLSVFSSVVYVFLAALHCLDFFFFFCLALVKLITEMFALGNRKGPRRFQGFEKTGLMTWWIDINLNTELVLGNQIFREEACLIWNLVSCY